MEDTTFCLEVEAALKQYNYTFEKLTFECWQGLDKPALTRVFQDNTTDELFTFTTSMLNLGIYTLLAKKGDGEYTSVYTYYDR
jgi:hypothetical protein